MPKRPPSPSPTAVRMRRYRRRLRDGSVFIQFDVPARVIDRLIDDGLLPARSADDPTAIAAVLLEKVGV